MKQLAELRCGLLPHRWQRMRMEVQYSLVTEPFVRHFSADLQLQAVRTIALARCPQNLPKQPGKASKYRSNLAIFSLSLNLTILGRMPPCQTQLKAYNAEIPDCAKTNPLLSAIREGKKLITDHRTADDLQSVYLV